MFDWASYLKTENRHFPTEEHWKYFDSIITIIEANPCIYVSGSSLFRARKHKVGQDLPFSLIEIGAPPASVCSGGRCNPEGIPYLYLADSAETAVAETRPWKDALVSVGEFELQKDLKLADLRGFGHTPNVFTSNDSSIANDAMAKVLMLLFLKDSFSRPGHEESKMEYAPTQFVSSMLKWRGFDGIIYSSLLKALGNNIVAFDVSSAEAKSVVVHEVWTVSYGTRVKAQPGDAANT